MSYWRRTGYKILHTPNSTVLLPFQVVLGGKEWLTIRRPGTHFDPMVGRDIGGDVKLHPNLRSSVINMDLFNRYVLQRRARKQLFVGAFDEHDAPIMCEKGETYYPRMGNPKDFGTVGVAYDMVISFETPLEAVTFRMMFQGIL